VIPPFLPTDTQMDAFTLNTTVRTVVMRHDLNAVLAAHRTSPFIMPFTN
jgi:sortase (surface protein transpeptidase)